MLDDVKERAKRLSARALRAEDAARAAREARDHAIREDRDRGAQISELAAAYGLSRPRIMAIIGSAPSGSAATAHTR